MRKWKWRPHHTTLFQLFDFLCLGSNLLNIELSCAKMEHEWIVPLSFGRAAINFE